MQYCVYVLISNNNNKSITYVGYTKNIKNRLSLHNISRGAKFTKGRKWIVLHKEIYDSKSKAMSREYKLKKDKKFRNFLKERFMKKNYSLLY
tara:strand:+ start:225 stop:500 length:276 start_codon:yes stop_codon:yes gene_type:complete